MQGRRHSSRTRSPRQREVPQNKRRANWPTQTSPRSRCDSAGEPSHNDNPHFLLGWGWELKLFVAKRGPVARPAHELEVVAPVLSCQGLALIAGGNPIGWAAPVGAGTCRPRKRRMCIHYRKSPASVAGAIGGEPQGGIVGHDAGQGVDIGGLDESSLVVTRPSARGRGTEGRPAGLNCGAGAAAALGHRRRKSARCRGSRPAPWRSRLATPSV